MKTQSVEGGVKWVVPSIVTNAVKFNIFVIVMAVIAGAMGQGVHQLWNWLMPGIFGLPSIGFWQGLGLLALSWILFGGFGWLGARPGRHSFRRRRMKQMWDQMDPEQRAKWREGLRGGGKPSATPPEGSTA
ncbi:MAG: hypothetical protein ACRD3T_00845 [Terriglobia bacterium]